MLGIPEADTAGRMLKAEAGQGSGLTSPELHHSPLMVLGSLTSVGLAGTSADVCHRRCITEARSSKVCSSESAAAVQLANGTRRDSQ